MSNINAQTIIAEVMAAHAIAPDDGTEYITFKTSERGTHRIINDKAHLQRFADAVRKNAAAFGGGLIREAKTAPAVSYASKTISLYKQLIEDKDWYAALQLAEGKLSPLFFFGNDGKSHMQVAPIPLDSEPRLVSLLGEDGKWSVCCPVSMLGLDSLTGNKRSRQAQIDAADQHLRVMKPEKKEAMMANAHARPVDQSAARAQWMQEHGIVDDAAIEARIEAQAAQDVAEVVAQAVAVSAIAEAMAPAAETADTRELVTCEAQENSAGNASGFTPTHTPAVAVSGAIWGKKVDLNVIQAPSGKFIYVGSVPNGIGYVDGATPEQIANGLHFGGRFGPKTRAFDTEEDAIKFAESNGYTVENKQATPATRPVESTAVSTPSPEPVQAVEIEATTPAMETEDDNESTNVANEAKKHGMTSTKEQHKYISGLWFYSIKKDGIQVGRLFKDEWDGFFDVEIPCFGRVGVFSLDDAMVEINEKNAEILEKNWPTTPAMESTAEPVAPVVETEAQTAAKTPDDQAKFNIRAKSGAWFACVYMIGVMYGLRFDSVDGHHGCTAYATHQDRMQALEAMARATTPPDSPPDGGLPIATDDAPTEEPMAHVAECTPGAPVAVSRAKPEHDLQVGDVVRSSWGYDQTNVNHYQVTKLIGKRTVEVRELAKHQDATGHMSGRVAPVWGEFIGEAMRRTVDKYGHVNILREKFGRASKIEPVAVVHGVRCYASTGYSSYA